MWRGNLRRPIRRRRRSVLANFFIRLQSPCRGQKKPPLTARNLRRIKVTLDPQPGAKYNWDGLISSPEIGGEEADPSAEFNFRGRGPPFDVVCSKNFSELII